ncbi:Immunoglobulin E-set [Arabidopsis suecica]|uniref:Immunoglobulin E-set n=1 Tax=Arabidopsis suecica TaxID=45249 RepID=A0A8T2FCZ5_ARASU|nr:Immunoglobulin E-set [Arabidopsis suecica]
MAISHVHLFLLLILSLFLLPTLRAIDYSDCGDVSSPVEVTSVEEVLKEKDMASFTVSGSTSKNITGGYIDVEVKIGLIRYSTSNYDLCACMACPVAPGAFVLPLDNLFRSYPI